MSATASASSMSSWFGDATPFKVQVNFDIPLFEGKIDVDALDNWLNVLEGYFSVHNFFNKEKITFVLLKEVPHVQNWWGTYCEKKSLDESGMFETNPTWASFIDAIREQYYPVGNYDDQYTKWTILHQERDQMVSEYTNKSHTLRTKLSIKDSERHLILKYHSGLHRYN